MSPRPTLPTRTTESEAEVTSLQRELAEAREQNERLMAAMREALILVNGRDLRTAQVLSKSLDVALDLAPAPSDVKGEDDETDVVAAFAKLREISGNRWDSVDPDEYVRELRGGDCPLTPLTAPSVRGVLVDDGEPTHNIVEGDIYWNNGVYTPDTTRESNLLWQPLKVVPASEFGVAAQRHQRIATLQAMVQEQSERINRLTSAAETAESDAERLRNQNRELAGFYENMKAQMEDADMEAGRLRKAIGEACEVLGPCVVKDCGDRSCRGWKILQAALTPSPTAASGEKYADSLYVEAMTDAIKRATSAPAAESQGNAQHHSEGAKIPEGGSGSSAAESEGGERDMLEAPVPDSLWNQLMLERNSLAARLSASRARLAACEERCRELEAGIEKHQRQHQAIYEELDGAEKFDRELWSLLAPKAGGEDGVV